MIESILIILIVIAVLLMVFAVEWESFTLGFIDTIFWLVLTISMFQIELPYQYTDSTGVVHEAVHTIQDMYPIGWLFLLLSIVMMLFSMIEVFELLSGKRIKKML